MVYIVQIIYSSQNKSRGQHLLGRIFFKNYSMVRICSSLNLFFIFPGFNNALLVGLMNKCYALRLNWWKSIKKFMENCCTQDWPNFSNYVLCRPVFIAHLVYITQYSVQIGLHNACPMRTVYVQPITLYGTIIYDTYLF